MICSLWVCRYAQEKSNNSVKKRFQLNWESISSQYKIPEWYNDAKFGIFIHWGVYAVPAFHDEWYPRWMYKNDEKSEFEKAVFDHHIATYSQQDKFGYKDFIPMFKVEKWNPEEWLNYLSLQGRRMWCPWLSTTMVSQCIIVILTLGIL